MSRKTILRMQAVTDEDEIFNYLLRQSPAAARRFSDAYLEAVRNIVSKPYDGHRYLLGDESLAGLHYRRIAGFQHYLVLYRIQPSAVVIVRVLHTSRDFGSVFGIASEGE